MKQKILLRKNSFSGTLWVGPGILEFSEGLDADLVRQLNSFRTSPIPVLIDDFNAEKHESTIIRSEVDFSNQLFPRAIEQFLRERGYSVYTFSNETFERIKTILESYPDSEEKDSIEKKMETMTPRELSILYKELTKSISVHEKKES